MTARPGFSDRLVHVALDDLAGDDRRAAIGQIRELILRADALLASAERIAESLAMPTVRCLTGGARSAEALAVHELELLEAALP